MYVIFREYFWDVLNFDGAGYYFLTISNNCIVSCHSDSEKT